MLDTMYESPLSIATKGHSGVAEGLDLCFGLAIGQNIISYRGGAAAQSCIRPAIDVRKDFPTRNQRQGFVLLVKLPRIERDFRGLSCPLLPCLGLEMKSRPHC